MAGPWLGSDAVVKKGSTEIGYATGVTIGIDADLVKEYIIGQVQPGVLKTGAQTYPVRIDKMMLDTEYGSLVLNEGTVTIEAAPGGTATGASNPKITVGAVHFTSWEFSIGAEGVTMESLDGEGESCTLAAY